jgi:triosephosphate isomerase
MRKKIVAGNWKMNKDLIEGLSLASEVINIVKDEVLSEVQVVLAPPFVHLYQMARLLESNKNISLGAQNCSHIDAGAYTGEVAARMLQSVPCQYVILGHSERRAYFAESSAMVAQKASLVLHYRMKPIVCVGESLQEREQGKHLDFVKQQLEESLFHLDKEQLKEVVVAYEPVWAIGTGVNASSQQAQEMHAAIRAHIASQYGADIANNTSLLYGGSCKPDNAAELFACADVDGGLIGGASLKARDFVEIIKAC